MSDFIFLFDLDSTVTKAEILPTLAKKIEKYEELSRLTEYAMQGNVPFRDSFPYRAGLLKDIPIDIAQNIVNEIPLNENIANFIREYHDRCYIVTGNLDCWICKLLINLRMDNHCFCSKGQIKNNKLERIVSLLDKKLVCDQILTPFVGVGDGANDLPLIKQAKCGIAYAGVRSVPKVLIECADYVVDNDMDCVELLHKLL